eukprot:UN15533
MKRFILEVYGMLYNQMDAMFMGASAAPDFKEYPVTKELIIQMNYFQDLFEISGKFANSSELHQSCTGCGPNAYVSDLLNSHCSAIVKMRSDLNDIFFAHNTWFGYPIQSSFYKVTELNGQNLPSKGGARRISQSTFPGMLFGGQP